MDNNLRKLRRMADMSQERLAEKVKISRVYVSMIERGEAIPSVTIAGRISKALDVSIEELKFT